MEANSNSNSNLVPLLVVRGAAAAIDFYVRALGASVLARYEHGPHRHVGHADLCVVGTRFALTEKARAWNSDAPESLGGSPVVLQLEVIDAAAVLGSMCDAGAVVVFPLQNFVGERMARVRDPFGHLWIVRERLEVLSVEEIQRQRDELFAQFAPRTANAPPPAGVESGITLGDGQASPQVRSAPVRPKQGPGFRRARIHLVLGPVGAGKSTYARVLARKHAALRLTLDDWMVALFRPDRPDTGVVEWYVERSARCIAQMWALATQTLEVSTDVVLEIGLLRRCERDAFYERVRAVHADMTLHLIDAPREVRRRRVEERNAQRGETFCMVVPSDVFEAASDLWEPLEADEREEWDFESVWTDA